MLERFEGKQHLHLDNRAYRSLYGRAVAWKPFKHGMQNSAIHEESHLRVLRLLEENPHMSQRDLAEASGVSLGKANYCVKALLDKGLIKIQNFRNSQNKLAYAYLLTPAGISAKADLTALFLKRKIAEYEALRYEIELLKREIETPHANSSDEEGRI